MIVATYSGSECVAWAGHRNGPGYAAQGNILVGGDTVDALAATYEATAGQSAPVSPCSATTPSTGGRVS